MNKKNKSTLVVAAIIVLLLVIAGLVSCSIRRNLNSSNITGGGNTDSDHVSNQPNDEPNHWNLQTESSTKSNAASPGTTNKKSDFTANKSGKSSHDTKSLTELEKTMELGRPADPVSPNKPQIPEIKPGSPVNPNRPGSGGRISYPPSQVEIITPKYSHTDLSFEVKAVLNSVKTLEWSITDSEGNAIAAEQVKGSLDKAGGEIMITMPGEYVLHAKAINYGNCVYEFSKNISILPDIGIFIELPKTVHTDQEFTVKAVLSTDMTQQLNWHILKNGNEVKWEDHVSGTLTNTGGTIRVTEKGNYTLKAVVYDSTSREFSGESSVQVYPVPQLTFHHPEAAHTDDQFAIEVAYRDMEDLTAIWFVDNTFGFQDWDTYIDGELHNNGGTIRFKRAGVYDLQARVTDSTGRVFCFNSGKIEILPVLTLSFVLPEAAHTDTIIDVRTRGNNSVLPIQWALIKNGIPISLEEAIDGSLNTQGGRIRFASDGEYRLTATMFDALGRVFSCNEKISIYPLRNCNFSIPNQVHAGNPFAVTMDQNINLGDQNITWTSTKDGQSIDLSSYIKGSLDNNGGSVFTDEPGQYILTAAVTDSLGRVFSDSHSISVTNAAPTTPKITANVTRTYAGRKFHVPLSVTSTDPDGDNISYEYQGKETDDYYTWGTYTVKVRAKDNYGGVSDWAETTFSVVNSSPNMPALSANVTRTVKSGKFLVNFTLVPSTDPDGDAVSYEYQNKTSDSYYSLGTHTVQVRAKDNYGGVSAWASVSFTIANNAPTRPVITRTPGGNSVVPGTPVTIKASSTDSDGDPITYVWDGRGAETSTYPMGKNTVRVKAVDNCGAESPWAAIVFFVMDSNGSGGMMLTGPESVILENGVAGATITKWTFNVPPVSGHSANYDYGEVRGYNQVTNKWERLTNVSFNASIGSSFAATDGNTGRVYSNNGVYMSGTLNPGIYSKLQFYYYTPHDCMYQKSNITYSVEYYFE